MKNIKAFSLIELSIVLIIIGLLIGGIVAGKQMISLSRTLSAQSLTVNSPVSQTENLVLWLETTSKDSFDESQRIDGAAVSQWNDINPLLTSKNNATQSSSGNRPIYTNDAINGLPALEFDKDSNPSPGDHLTLGSNYIFSTGNGMTIFAVAEPSLTSGGSSSFIYSFGFHAGYHYGLYAHQQELAIMTPTNHGGVFDLIGTNPQGTNPTILTFRIEFDVRQQLFLNGSATAIIDSPITLSQLTANEISNTATRQYYSGPVTIGGQSKTQSQSGRYFDGNIGEIIVYDRALTIFEREQIEEYLSQKWKIKLSD